MKNPRLALLVLPLALAACRSTYYSMWETLGVHKRDILVDRVEKGREDQEAAKEQIQTTFEAFQALTGFEGGDIEDAYEDLKKEYDRSEARADDVRERIESIEKVATDLFREWEVEIEEISSADLKRRSETLIRDTRARYEELMVAMRTAESKMAPVLTAFNDHVLVLKHELNAQAIASLESSLMGIEGDVAELIADMQRSIEEADEFVAAMKS